MLHTNNHWFLCISWPSEEYKTFTITAWGEQRTESDHLVLVFHKWQIKEIAWKDLGNTMQLIRLVPNRIAEINKQNDMSDWFVRTVRSVLGWYRGYDEESNMSYAYIPKITGQKLVEKLNILDFFVDKYDITIVDEKKWRITIGSNINISEEEKNNFVLGQYLWLAALYGKATITNNILHAYKIQAPILDYTIVNNLNAIVTLLRSYHFVINAYHNESQYIYEITTNDYDLLAYIRILYGDEMEANLIDKTLDLRQEIFIQYGLSANQQAMRWKLYEVKR